MAPWQARLWTNNLDLSVEQGRSQCLQYEISLFCYQHLIIGWYLKG
jgi:hypothetical protein